MISRTRINEYVKSYVENPSNDYELQKDDSIKQEIKTLRFQRVLVGLMIQTYIDGNFTEPEELKLCKKGWIDETDCNFVEKFKEDYEITNDKNDFVYSNEIEGWVKSKDFGITMKSLVRS
jgi:hypothetical protein